jgi:hypothetical protein
MEHWYVLSSLVGRWYRKCHVPVNWEKKRVLRVTPLVNGSSELFTFGRIFLSVVLQTECIISKIRIFVKVTECEESEESFSIHFFFCGENISTDYSVNVRRKYVLLQFFEQTLWHYWVKFLFCNQFRLFSYMKTLRKLGDYITEEGVWGGVVVEAEGY